MENYFQEAKSKFASGFRWSFIGSIVFESSYILHSIFLFYLAGSEWYGLFGSLFSIIYLVINIADLGFNSSLAPYLSTITQDRKTFLHFFSRYVFTQVGLFSIIAIASLYFYRGIFLHSQQPLPFLFFFLIIISEGVRIFLRRFLHNIFLSKTNVLGEQIFSILFYSMVWIPYLFGAKLTISRIFLPYFFESCGVTIFFVLLVKKFYQTLPEHSQHHLPRLWTRIIKTRYYNSIINLETFVISGNFLVPFFATTFGFKQAGLFTIATTLAHSVRALIKSIVHFPGVALLVSVQSHASHIKTEAFRLITSKLNQFTAFILIFLFFNYHSITNFFPQSQTLQFASSYSLIFIFITVIHQLFLAYEQFYIIEEFANKLFIIKSIELILFYFLILYNHTMTPLMILLAVALIQGLCFALLAAHAYLRWRIKPSFNLSPRFIIITTAFSFSIFMIFRIFS